MIGILNIAILLLPAQGALNSESLQPDQNLVLLCQSTEASVVKGSYELEILWMDGKWSFIIEPRPGSKFPIEKIKIDGANVVKMQFSDASPILASENKISTIAGDYRVSLAADFDSDTISNIVGGISIIPNEENGGAMAFGVMQTDCKIENGRFPAGSL